MCWGEGFPGNKRSSDWIAGFWVMGLCCFLGFFVWYLRSKMWDSSVISGKEDMQLLLVFLLLGIEIELCFLFVSTCEGFREGERKREGVLPFGS